MPFDFEFPIPDDLQEVANEMNEEELRYTVIFALSQIAHRNKCSIMDVAEGLLASLRIQNSKKQGEARLN